MSFLHGMSPCHLRMRSLAVFKRHRVQLVLKEVKLHFSIFQLAIDDKHRILVLQSLSKEKE